MKYDSLSFGAQKQNISQQMNVNSGQLNSGRHGSFEMTAWSTDFHCCQLFGGCMTTRRAPRASQLILELCGVIVRLLLHIHTRHTFHTSLSSQFPKSVIGGQSWEDNCEIRYLWWNSGSCGVTSLWIIACVEKTGCCPCWNMDTVSYSTAHLIGKPLWDSKLFVWRQHR